MSTVTRLKCEGCTRVVDGNWSEIPGWVHLKACTLFMSCADTVGVILPVASANATVAEKYSPHRLENVSDFCSLDCLAAALKTAPRQ